MTSYANKQEYYEDILTPVSKRVTPREKPTVRYLPMAYTEEPEVGFSVWVLPVDHPAEYLNNKPVITSTIVAVEGNGNFETLNTKYVLVTKESK